jgi:hypothetical protein
VTLIEQAVAAVVYLPLSLVSIVSAVRRHGRALAKEYGISRTKQIVQLIGYAWRLGVPPREYYQLRLHRHHWTGTGRHFIHQPELHHLQRHISPSDTVELEDKVHFAERARRCGVPIVPTIAILHLGRALESDETWSPIRLPQRHLFIKPTASYSSEGVMGVKYDAATGHYFDGERTWAPADLVHHLTEQSKRRQLLVQPWMENHPSLHGFSANALCNIRVVTGRRPDGTVEPIMAAFRFPWKSQVSCAEPGITLCASIDLKTGRMRAAEAKNPAIGQLKQHPISGHPIEGHMLSCWPELLETARAAHPHWREYPFIGWDLVHTSEGIFVLEGSCLWGGTLAQISGSLPLGLTAFAEIYLSLVKNRTAVRA